MDKDPREPSDLDSEPASAEEEEELRRMREAIIDRGSRRWWQLVPRKTLFKAFWLLILLLAILWFQRNTALMSGSFNETFGPQPSAPAHGPR